MKANIIKTCDFVAYLAFVVLLVVVAGACMAGHVMEGLIVGVAGWVILCLASGVWFVLSQIAEQSQRQTELLEKMLKNSVDSDL